MKLKNLILLLFSFNLITLNLIYSSLVNETSFGLFRNNVDSIMSPVYIFEVNENVVDFGLKDFSGSKNSWYFTIGLGGNLLPIKLGINVNDRETLSTINNYENIIPQYLDSDNDNIIDLKKVTSKKNYLFNEFYNRNFSLNTSFGIFSLKYNFIWNINRNLGKYDPDTINNKEDTKISHYDMNTNLLYEISTNYNNNGFNGSYGFYNIFTFAMKLGNLIPYVNLELDYLVNGFFGERTNYIYNKSSVIDNPVSKYTVRNDLKQDFIIGGTPGLLLILSDNPDNRIEAEANFNLSYKFLINPIILDYYSYTITKTLNLNSVSTNEEIRINQNYYLNYFELPMTLGLSTKYIKKFGQNFIFGVGGNINSSYKISYYRSLGTNIIKTIYNDGDNELNDSDDFVSITEDYYDTTDNKTDNFSTTLQFPIGVEIYLTKNIILRFGVNFNYAYSFQKTETIYIDSQPTKNQTTYGNGTTSVNYGTIGTLTSTVNKTDFSQTSTTFSTGLGFVFDNFNIDIKLSTKGNILDLNNWAIETYFKF